MGRKFLSGIVNHIWGNFGVFAIHILNLWPVSATFLLDMCHHNITLYLMNCLKLYLPLAMMP
ncbi:hypothetical protein ACHAXS_002501 [Conticribra weissflogii]